MIPKTKVQKEVEALSAKLRPLNKKDIRWAERNVPYFMGYEYGGDKVVCMHCGTRFAYIGGDKQRCPHCRKELHIKASLGRTYNDTECFALADSVGDWQVLRYFHVVTYCYRGGSAHIEIHEVMQRWIDSRCRYVVRSVAHRGYYAYQWSWIYGSPFEVRNVPNKYTYNRWDDEGYCELRIRKYSPRLKYVPYNKDAFGDFFTYCQVVASEPYAETLYKQGCYKLLKHCIDYRLFGKSGIMSAIKVALRHGYDIENNVQQWFDYLNTLRSLHLDIHNPVIICPHDLNTAEQKYLRILRKREDDERKRREYSERLARLEMDKKLNENYTKKFGKLFGVVIADGDISVHVLKDVDEFAKEGSELRHCVYANSYYDIEKHPFSLILDASVNGKRTETIEIDTRDYRIVQARGVCNQNSKFHKEIVELVNNNMERLKQAV